MKLEDQFFHSFFYPFIVGVILSATMVIISSIVFTCNYIDKGTRINIIELEKNYSKVNLNSINIIITTYLLKIQSGLNELINNYQNLANQIILPENNVTIDIENINDTFFKAAYDLYVNKTFSEEINNISELMALWFLDKKTNLNDTKNNIELRRQLKCFSTMMSNIYSTFTSINSTSSNFYFIFDKTELFVAFPLDYFFSINFTNDVMDFGPYNPLWCTDDEGNVHTTYKFKCRGYYNNIQKSKTDIFDYNYDKNINKTIFITDLYYQSGTNDVVFTLCIEFYDPITNDNAYACSDIYQNNILYNLNNINNKLIGYFFINSIGFSNSFYFPDENIIPGNPCESIFKWEDNFFLEEKTYFGNHIQKLMSSNYIKYINQSNDNLFDEIYINGINSYDQYFSVSGKIYNFSIYPIILENIYGSKEHIFNIIYIYNNDMFYERVNPVTEIAVKIIIEGIIFVVFGFGLLYLINLSLNILSKYIVIPIKNVNYMLKGINVGGENRLEYLEFLKKKQDENVELLEKINMNEGKNKKKENDEGDGDGENNNLNNDKNLIDENNKNKKNETKEDALENKEDMIDDNTNDQNDSELNDELMNSKVDYNKKFDEESEFIEKESNFYDFDEQLLQFRPLEIDRLVKALIDLKGALILTSSDQPVEQIIDYSNSEDIFRNFKNIEGATICQSNIGNLQSQLLKYDNAIYHLATSLQDNKLKRFLSRSLSDELDESDTLLNKIAMSYSKTKTKEKMNILIEKQLNNSKDNFSQKIIGILINSRYTRLIHVYYKFFSIIQKSNNDALSGQFMNTDFHKINYYHKILIQYIYLSFVKNDLVKIGESILDYIEFLLKFKFKTSSENKYILNIRNKDHPELESKQYYKHYIFNKIVSWLNLFDDYISHVRDNTSLGDDKSIIEDFSSSMNSNNSEFDSGSQSVFLFRVNVQRGEYLKGKFALKCKNLTDALFYFIRAAKKKSIVMDGLIKKKSLKRICKIIIKLFKKYDKYGIIRWQMKQKLMEYEKSKIRSFNKKYSSSVQIKTEDEYISNKKYLTTFKQELEKIKSEIVLDINECSAKQTKDIIIIMDFNKYNQDSINNLNNTDKIDSFIDQTKTILDNYLSSNDRLGVFIYTNQYQIICPLLDKKEIDLNNFSKDLIYYKKSIFKEKEENDEFNEDEMHENEIQNENIGLKQGHGSNFSDSGGSNESFKDKNDENHIKINEVVKGLIESINYSKNYLKMKEAIKNEKYIILFTDLFNNYKMSDENIYNNFKNIENDKDIIFLLVGKNKSKDLQKDKNNLIDDSIDEKKKMKSITKKFGERSEIIDFENMKKIKTILSSNNVIKDEIIYPNEIYK